MVAGVEELLCERMGSGEAEQTIGCEDSRLCEDRR